MVWFGVFGMVWYSFVGIVCKGGGQMTSEFIMKKFQSWTIME